MPSKKIRHFRLLKNYTQEHVALEVGISQSQMSKYESGETIPDAEMLRKFAKVLDVEIFEFFYESNKEVKQAFDRWRMRQE